MVPVLETERLWLRPLELADAEQVQQVFPKWEIVKHLANLVPWPYPEDGALLYYRDNALPAIERGEEWHWTLRLKSHPEQLIGVIGLFRNSQNNRGFWIDLPWQRQGLMTEAVEAVNRFWFEELGMPALRAPKAAANVGSCKISARTGMRLIETKDSEYVSGTLPTEIWEITAEEWRERQSNRHR